MKQQPADFLSSRRPNPVRPQRLADQVISEIKASLERGEFPIGSKLPTETQLMKEFNVGRSTIREAVRALVHSNVLKVQAGDGTYIRALPHSVEPLADRLGRAHIAEVFEVRRAFEVGIARLAAMNRTESDIKLIQKTARNCCKSILRGDNAAFLREDYNFHLAVASATKNQLLSDLYGVFRRTLSDAMAEALFQIPSTLKKVIDLHDLLTKAICAGDERAAQAVWLKAPNPFLENNGARKRSGSTRRSKKSR